MCATRSHDYIVRDNNNNNTGPSRVLHNGRVSSRHLFALFPNVVWARDGRALMTYRFPPPVTDLRELKRTSPDGMRARVRYYRREEDTPRARIVRTEKVGRVVEKLKSKQRPTIAYIKIYIEFPICLFKKLGSSPPV